MYATPSLWKNTVEIEKYVKTKNIVKIYPGTQSITRMIALLKTYEVAKQEVFDLQLAATMLSNNVTRIYTYNQNDFSKFKELEVLTPWICIITLRQQLLSIQYGEKTVKALEWVESTICRLFSMLSFWSSVGWALPTK